LTHGAYVERHCGELRSVRLASVTHFNRLSDPPTEIEPLEPGLLGEPRHDRIERHRGDDEFVPSHELAELLPYLLMLIAAMLVTLLVQ
jgi:hypothetical protein